jgi:protein SCO1/2
MKRFIPALVLIFLVLMISVFIMIMPSFYTEGVSRFELKEDLSLELVCEDKQDIELVFFGYAGCTDVCTPRLENLGKWYDTLSQKTKEHVRVKFLDLSVPQDKTLPDNFAKAFHPDFKGVFLDDDILRVYTKTFSVYFAKSLIDDTQMDHTTNLYLIKRDDKRKQLRYIYTAFPYDFAQIESDIQGLIHE